MSNTINTSSSCIKALAARASVGVEAVKDRLEEAALRGGCDRQGEERKGGDEFHFWNFWRAWFKEEYAEVVSLNEHYSEL